MSAIVGIYNRTGQPVGPSCLKGMTDILAHRGPDGVGVWTSGPVGLGHRMLWTTPESLHELLPFADDTAGLTITADARIDNRDELLPLLGLPDGPTALVSDSQVILAAYQKWGEDCPNHLLGDFAFAIWDEAIQKLFCARDHFGVKPFYYYLSDEMFAFATEIKALLTLPDVPQVLNEDRIGSYLASVFDETVSTFYQKIVRLPPAYCLTVSPQQIKLECYWKLDPSKNIFLGSDEEYASQFRTIFNEAVKCRLRSVGPIGSFLSGGLDSSSIVCIARNELKAVPKELHTFSAIFSQTPECDESLYIKTVLDKGNIQSTFLDADNLSVVSELTEMLGYADEPFFGPGLYSKWALNRLVRQEGVRVMLDGHDGDTAVSHGFGYLSELAQAGQWFALMKQLRGLAISYQTSPWTLLRSYMNGYLVQPLTARFRGIGLGRKVWHRLRNTDRNNVAPEVPVWDICIEPEFSKKFSLNERQRAWVQSTHSMTTEREDHYRGLTSPMQPLALETLDKAAAAFGIETRFPFWDKRLVEFCLALPPQQKLSQGWSRIVLRRAMAGVLPPEIQWRREKTDFTPAITRMLSGTDQARLRVMTERASVTSRRFVNTEKLMTLFAGAIGKQVSGDLIRILQPVTLLQWLDSERGSGASVSRFIANRKEVTT